MFLLHTARRSDGSIPRKFNPDSRRRTKGLKKKTREEDREMRWRIGSKAFLASAEVRRRNRAKWMQPGGVKITDATAEESRSVGSTHPA